MAILEKAMRGDHKASEAILKLLEKLHQFVSRAATAPSHGKSLSNFAWTEEDESLRPFLDHLLYGPSIYEKDEDDARRDEQRKPGGSSPAGDHSQPSASADKAKG